MTEETKPDHKISDDLKFDAFPHGDVFIGPGGKPCWFIVVSMIDQLKAQDQVKGVIGEYKVVFDLQYQKLVEASTMCFALREVSDNPTCENPGKQVFEHLEEYVKVFDDDKHNVLHHMYRLFVETTIPSVEKLTPEYIETFLNCLAQKKTENGTDFNVSEIESRLPSLNSDSRGTLIISMAEALWSLTEESLPFYNSFKSLLLKKLKTQKRIDDMK